MSALKKLSAPTDCPRLASTEVWPATGHFENDQEEQSKGLNQLSKSNIIHLGGGHDHVYSLLNAMKAPVCAINIDAHLDTRKDSLSHSGNPFRIFDSKNSFDFQLHQIGIHHFANSTSTKQPLANGSMFTLTKDQTNHKEMLQSFLQRIETGLSDETIIIFSLDCDAIDSSQMSAVSAPNHDGLSVEFIADLIYWYKDLCTRRSQKNVFGIYEFNPLYDTVSSQGARVLAGLMYKMISR